MYNILENDCCWEINFHGILCMESSFWKSMVHVTLKVKHKN